MMHYFAHMNDLPVLAGAIAAIVTVPLALIVIAVRRVKKGNLQ